MKKLILTILSLIFTTTFLLFGQNTPQNIVVQNNSSDQHETAISFNPNNHNVIMAAWNDFQIEPVKPGYAFSTDGGTSWSHNLIPDIGNYRYGFDPSCAFDNNGNAYYAFIAYKNDPNEKLGPVYISYTSNYGSNWTNYKVSNLLTLQDKCYMTIDNTGGMHDGRIYVTWTDFYNGKNKIKLAYSDNKGASFTIKTIDESVPAQPMDPLAVSLSPTSHEATYVGPLFQSSVPVVASNGDLYVTWLYLDDNHGFGPGKIYIKRSTNGGDSFGSRKTAASFSSGVFGGGYDVGVLRTSSSPTIVIDPATNNIYIAYMALNTSTNYFNIFLVRSTNSGNSWSSPTKLPKPSTGNTQIMPWMAINQNGKISMLYYDAPSSSSVDAYIADIFDNNGSYQITSNKISSVTSNPKNVENPKNKADYVGIISIDETKVIPLWMDFRSNNADIYTCKYYSSSLPGAPSQPQNLQISGNFDDEPILTWDPNTESDVKSGGKYKIYRSFDPVGNTPSNWELAATINAYNGNTPVTTWTDFDALVGGNSHDISYKISAVDNTQKESVPSDVQTIVGRMPKISISNSKKIDSYKLNANYPNPFNPTTIIAYQLPKKSHVLLRVYNTLGEEVATLVNEEKEPGYYNVSFNAANLPSGLYLYKLTAGNFTKVGKMMLLK